MFGFCNNGLWGGGWWGGGWMMAITWIFWLLLIGAGVWLLVILIRRNRQLATPTSALPPGESALDILRKRYARGEITKEEYDDMRRAIAD